MIKTDRCNSDFPPTDQHFYVALVSCIWSIYSIILNLGNILNGKKITYLHLSKQKTAKSSLKN